MQALMTTGSQPGGFRDPNNSIPLSLIEAVAAGLVRRQFGTRLRALVLTGSMARGEASFVQENEAWRVQGDAEFLVVLDRCSKDDEQPCRRASDGISSQLAAEGIHCKITLAAADESYLRSLPPHIFGYELRNCGRVIWGDTAVLALIPNFLASSIPLEDAFRILCNRLLEHLDFPDEILCQKDPSDGLRYRTVKLYLDMCTSFLLFTGAYKPTYIERARELEVLAEKSSADLPISRFAEKVRAATRIKLQSADPSVSMDFSTRQAWLEAIIDAQLLWRWELGRLLTSSDLGSDERLMREWCGSQSLAQRVRGWLLVVRATGWIRDWKNWGRWCRLYAKGSPRTLIYSAGCRLLFEISRGADPSRLEALCHELTDLLPLITRDGTGNCQKLGSEIAWNYHQFVEMTRS